jgi:hypothetical protein
MPRSPSDRFELSLLGGAIERRYRKLRPEVDRVAWHKLESAKLSPELRARARRFWTLSAYAEHRAAAAFGAIVRALVEARAPLDLAALASTYALDELSHVELCARVANALGGGASLAYDPEALVPPTTATLPALGRAAELVLEVNCISESFLQPIGRLQLDTERHPTLRAVSSRILKDESAHAGFGWTFFDWARPLLDEETRQHLRARAARSIDRLRSRPVADDDDAATFGWMTAKSYRREAPRLIDERIVEPLRARGLL